MMLTIQELIEAPGIDWRAEMAIRARMDLDMIVVRALAGDLPVLSTNATVDLFDLMTSRGFQWNLLTEQWERAKWERPRMD